MEARDQCQEFFSIALHAGFSDTVFHQTWNYFSQTQTGRPTTSPRSAFPHFLVLGLQIHATTPGFYVSAQDPYCSSHVCRAGIYLPKPFQVKSLFPLSVTFVVRDYLDGNISTGVRLGTRTMVISALPLIGYRSLGKLLAPLQLQWFPPMSNIYLPGLPEERMRACHSSDPHKCQASAFNVITVIIQIHKPSTHLPKEASSCESFFAKIMDSKIKHQLATSKKALTQNLKSDIPMWAMACSFLRPMA